MLNPTLLAILGSLLLTAAVFGAAPDAPPTRPGMIYVAAGTFQMGSAAATRHGLRETRRSIVRCIETESDS